MRCGACNEVFDGNAALLEQPAPAPLPTPLPDPATFDVKMAALDTRAAEVLGSAEAEPVLEFDTPAAEPEAIPAAQADSTAAEPRSIAAVEADSLPPVAGTADAPDGADETAVAFNFVEPAEPAESLEPAELIASGAPAMPDEPDGIAPFALPAEPAVLPTGAGEEFDLDLEIDAAPTAANKDSTAEEVVLDDVASLSDEELAATLEAEIAAMELTLAEVPQDDADRADTTDGRIEPSWDEPAPAADAPPTEAPAMEQQPAPASTLREEELEEVDEEALVQLSSTGLAEAQAERAHAFLRAQEPEPEAASDEPGFVKRDRQRQKYGKAATIGMGMGSVLLVGALLAQALTTFRNPLAAAMPPLKPVLTAACQALGCKIELPTQIDALSIEQGELQTLSETTFSFTTLLRNQSTTAQGWPSIELVLDDDRDQRVLRRVFGPRDYLGPDIALEKGFAPHTEQTVKLYFELRDVKASGYHIAVFYP